MSQTRRHACLGLLALLPSSALAADRIAAARERLASIEGGLGGRLGVAAHAVGATTVLGHRAAEPFPLCSTFKALATAAILARVDAGTESLDRSMRYDAADLDRYAPVTGPALAAAGGETAQMSLDALCAAAMIRSDNTAANLMLRALGGPDALTAWLRGTGDPATRLDRSEPDLNTAIPDDPRDTTTPAAMAATLERCLVGDVLARASRTRLEAWMVAAETGRKRLRAGLPPDWEVGDKTGTGANGTANVVAILRPPGRVPILAAVYMTGSAAPGEVLDAAHAEIGRLIAATF